jgi:hypothetical protein
VVYGAGAAGFRPRNRAALALIFGMHILALFAWMRQRPSPLPEMPHVVSILLRSSVPQPKPQAAEPLRPFHPSAPPPSPLIQDDFDLSSRPAPRDTADTENTTAAPPAAAPSPPSVSPLEDAHAPITVQDAIREQKQAGGGFGASLSRRQAGRIDRELRNGKSGVPDEPDTPIGRFQRGLEAAHIDRSMSVREDSYTAPDGIVYYRKRIGNATFCRRSGSVSPMGMRGIIMGNEAGDVPCPTGVLWKKD